MPSRGPPYQHLPQRDGERGWRGRQGAQERGWERGGGRQTVTTSQHASTPHNFSLLTQTTSEPIPKPQGQRETYLLCCASSGEIGAARGAGGQLGGGDTTHFEFGMFTEGSYGGVAVVYILSFRRLACLL